MLRETGRVVALEEDAVWVETIRSSACGRCAARSGCGHGVLARTGSTATGLVRVLATAMVSAGDCSLNDEVEIELPESAVLRGSLLLYLLPLGCAVLGAVMGDAFGDLAAILGFAAGLGAGFLLVRRITLSPGILEQFEPRLVAVLKPDSNLIVAG